MQGGADSLDHQAKLRHLESRHVCRFRRPQACEGAAKTNRGGSAAGVELGAETGPASGRSICVRKTPESRETFRTG